MGAPSNSTSSEGETALQSHLTAESNRETTENSVLSGAKEMYCKIIETKFQREKKFYDISPEEFISTFTKILSNEYCNGTEKLNLLFIDLQSLTQKFTEWHNENKEKIEQQIITKNTPATAGEIQVTPVGENQQRTA